MGLRLYLRGLGLGIIVTALLMGYSLGNRKEAMTDSEIKARAADLGMVEEDKLLIKPSEETGPEAGEIVVEGDQADREQNTEPLIDDDEPSDVPSSDDAIEASADKEMPADIEFEDGSDADSDPDTVNQTGRNGESTHELNVSGSIDNGQESPAEEVKEADSKVEQGKTPSSEAEDAKEVAEAPSQKTEDNKTADSGNSNKTGSEKINVGKVSDSMQVAKELEKAGIIDDASKFDEYLISRRIDRYIGSGSYDIPRSASFDEIAKILTGR